MRTLELNSDKVSRIAQALVIALQERGYRVHGYRVRGYRADFVVATSDGCGNTVSITLNGDTAQPFLTYGNGNGLAESSPIGQEVFLAYREIL